MSRLLFLGVLLGLCVDGWGCAARMSFPSAKPSDIIACRTYASTFGAVWANTAFNNCMLEAGYEAAP